MATDDEVPASSLAREVAQDLMTAWALRLSARGLRPQTIRHELVTTGALLNHSAKMPWDLKERDLLEWAAHLIQVRGLRASSVDASLATACRFLRYLANSKHVRRYLNETLGIAEKRLNNLGNMRILRSRRAIEHGRRQIRLGSDHHKSVTEAYVRVLPSDTPEIAAHVTDALNPKRGANNDND